MSFLGNGVFVINTSGQPVSPGTTIQASVFNALTADLATGLSTCLTIDGQSTPTANIKLGGFKIINLGPGTVSTDAVNLSQLQTGANKLISASGTNTITGTMNPTLLAKNAGDTFTFVVPNTNTGAVTLNIDTLGAKAITKNGTQALVAGDLIVNSIATVTFDGTQFQLLDPNIQTNLIWAAAAGTSDAITGAYSPAITTLIDGLLLGFRASAANTTTTPTFKADGTTAHTITKNGGAALVAGDIPGANAECLVRYRLSSTTWELLNPKGYTSPTTTQGDIIVRGASADARLAVGTAHQAPISNGTTLVYGTVIEPATSQTLSAGFPVTVFSAGTQSSGTFTPSIANGEVQSVVNGGAHTLAPPTADGTLTLQYTNNGSAGAITTSGFTKVNGAFTTTNGDDFFANIIKAGSFSLLTIVALQ